MASLFDLIYIVSAMFYAQTVEWVLLIKTYLELFLSDPFPWQQTKYEGTIAHVKYNT